MVTGRRGTMTAVKRWVRAGGMAAVATMALLPVGRPLAQTPPMGGAVSLPGDFALSLPFPDGTPVRASCAYGPGCSAYHVNTNVGCCTNDYYALDLVRDQAGNGDGEPVTAMAAGTVIYADWATGGFSSFGRYVAIEHDYAGDGHTYFSIYAHLSSIGVGVGEHVEMKQTIGNLGGSSNMLDGQFGAHVHLALYQDANLGNGGMHGGLAVVPEPIDGFEDLMHGTVMVAGPGPAVPPPPGGDTGGDGSGGGETTGDTSGVSSASGGSAPPDPSTSGGDPGGDGVGDSGGVDAGPADTDDDPAMPGGDSEALPDAIGSRGGDDGCACTSDPTAPPPWPLALALLLFVRRRD